MDYLLLGLLIAGALGLWAALPRVHSLWSAAVLLLGGAAALLIMIMQRNVAPQSPLTTFVIFGLIALLAGIRVITHRKAVYSALYFVLVVVSVAALLVLSQAEFLAIALVIIYAGAILVTYVFVIMLAQQTGGPPAYDQRAKDPLLGVLAGFVLLAGITGKLVGTGGAVTTGGASKAAVLAGDVEHTGTTLLTDYAVGVEIAGVLLLAAMVGAIVIARRKAPVGYETEGP
jgi:NADH-quinone oxidoreductase subunit J